MKTCINADCKETNPQPEEAFPLEREGKYSWRRKECSACRSAKAKARRDPNREEYNAYMRQWNKDHPDAVKSNVLKKMYKIDLEQYNQMLKAQNSGCAICGGRSRNERLLCVDHDHSCCPGKKACGKCVRGLLCDGCNRGISILENSELLAKAKAYLAK